MSTYNHRGMNLLSPEDRKLVLRAQESIDRIPMSGAPADIFKALQHVIPVSGGMVGQCSARNPESMVTRDFNLSDRMVQGFYGSSQEHLALMFAPLFVAQAGMLVPATQGLPPVVREQIKLLQITTSEGYGETAGYKVCDPEKGSHYFTFLTLALEGPHLFTPRDHVLLGALQRPLYAALERLRIPLIPSDKIRMQVMEEENKGYLLVSPKTFSRCIEANGRGRLLVERYAESSGIDAGSGLVLAFAQKAALECAKRTSWIIERRQGDGELKVRIHYLHKDSHNIGEEVALVTMEETLYPVDFDLYEVFGFTPREIEIVQLLVDSEYTAKEIAEELNTSYHTVRTQIQKIREKADVTSRSGLSSKLKMLSRRKRR